MLFAVAGFFSAAAFRLCDPLLPQFAADFNTTTGSAAHAITAFTIAYGVLQLFWGPVGDRYGKYRTAAFATAACAIGNIGAVFASSLTMLIVCRAIAGATGGGIVPLAFAWIGDTVPYAQRQIVLARFITGTILGIASGQFIGGLFADTLGWRWAFAALAIGYIVVGALLQVELSRAIRHAGDAGVSELPVVATAPQTVRARVAAILRDRWARVVLVTVLFEGAIVFGALAFVPAALHARFGISLTAAGAIVAAFGAGGIAYTLIARRLVIAMGELGLAIGGGIVMLLAFAALWLATASAIAIAGCFALGLGFYMLHNTLQTNATQISSSSRGIAVAMFASFFFVGQSVGVALASVVVDHVGGEWLDPIAMVLLPALAFAFARLLRTRPAQHY